MNKDKLSDAEEILKEFTKSREEPKESDSSADSESKKLEDTPPHEDTTNDNIDEKEIKDDGDLEIKSTPTLVEADDVQKTDDTSINHEIKKEQQEKDANYVDQTQSRNIIFIGTKPIMTYVTSTLTQLSTLPKVTLKARGRRLTQAVDVSQMIVKRMNTVGYKIGDVRIASDLLASKDGKKRSVSTIEIDITSENN